MSISCFVAKEMPAVALNVVLSEARVFSGETLDATVLVDATEPDVFAQDFVAEVRGVTRTGWVNIHTDKIYDTEQEFFGVDLPLCQPQMPLRPGRHRFSLRVTIPDTMPSSFENQFGSIRYTIRLNLFTNSAQSSATELFPFFVVSRSFFEDVPKAVMQPIDYRDEIDFTVCSLPFGTVYLEISLPRTAFRLGESIAARIHVNNATRKTIKDCRLHLLLKTQFEAMSRYEHASDSKLIEQIIDTWPLGRVNAKTEKSFENCCLRIPQTAIPTHNNNNSNNNNSRMSNNISIQQRQQQQPYSQNLAALVVRGQEDNAKSLGNNRSLSGANDYDDANSTTDIALSYVLRFTALPGIETEIPLVVTTDGFRNRAHRISDVLSSNYAVGSGADAPKIQNYPQQREQQNQQLEGYYQQPQQRLSKTRASQGSGSTALVTALALNSIKF